MMRQMDQSRGFTLVELVMILCIAGILMVSASSRFFTASDLTGRAFYEELMGAARYAQKLAVSTGCQVQLTVTSNSFSLAQRNLCDTVSAFTRAVPHPSRSGDFTPTRTSPLTVAPAPTTLVFDAMGRASSTVTISVGTASFKIHGETGFIEKL